MKIINFVVFTCLIVTGSSTLYWPCETQADCTAEESTCSSATSQCECSDFDSVFSSDFTKCLKTSLIGDQCEDSVQCNLMPTGAKCNSGVCDCADGETYVRGRCRPLNGLNQYCDTDLDCYFAYDRESVQCNNNICTCTNGYYNRHGNICRRKSMEIGDACVVHTDCDNLGENVKCQSLKCQYVDELKSKANYNNNRKNNNNNNVISTSNTRTKRQTSTPTETVSNLSKSSPSESDLNIATKLVNGLSSGSIKTNKSSVSNKNNNNNNTLSDTASEDLNTESQKETLAVATNKEAQKSREIAVQTSIDAFELKVLKKKVRNVGTITTTASTSSSSRRPSKQRHRRRPTVFRFEDDEKTISTVSNTDDDAENRMYGDSCTSSGLPCAGLPHSICSSSICLCKQGYYNKNGNCFAELGEIAETEDECEHEFDAVTKKCICQKNYFYDANLRGCRKPIQFHLSCTGNNQCSPFGAAYCYPEIPKRCTCSEYAQYDELLQMCVYKQGLGSECEADEGCPVQHAMCSNRVCVCKENFIRKDDECLPGIGAECVESDECQVENSVCDTDSASNARDDLSKSCQCRKGFVHFKDECLKEAEEIEDECNETEQCKPLLATCVNKKCSCSNEQHFQNGRCESKKGINEACSKASECYLEKDVENVECRNSVCQCKFGYKIDSEHRSCYASSKKSSSGRPSALKIITFVLIGSAFLITSAALKQAYY